MAAHATLQVHGTWKRGLKENSVEIKMNPFKKLNEGKLEFIKKAAENYGNFLNKDVSLFRLGTISDLAKFSLNFISIFLNWKALLI